MNNKTQTLDPKLKAIYDQVMGTVVAPPTPAPSSSAPSIASTQLPSQQQVAPNARPTLVTEQTQSLVRPSIPVDKGLYGSLSTTPPTVQPSATIDKVSVYSANTTVKEPQKAVSPFMPIILTTSGIIFFVVYTVFWIKFFGLSVPFLPI